MVTGGCRLLQGLLAFQEVTGGYHWLQEVTRGYKGLRGSKGVTIGYYWLQQVTWAYKGLQKITMGYIG